MQLGTVCLWALALKLVVVSRWLGQAPGWWHLCSSMLQGGETVSVVAQFFSLLSWEGIQIYL